MTAKQPVTRKCTGTSKTTGKPCGKPPMHGATVCRVHGGQAPQVRKKAAVRAELEAWGLGDATDDPGDVLLRLVTQSRRRADLYATLLEDAYTAAAATDTTYAAAWAMPKGVAALIGYKFAFPNQSTVPVPVAEAIRGLVELEAAERDRCARFCTQAIAGGLAERMVRVHEREASLAHQALIAGLDAAGITGDLRARVLDGTVAHLRLIAG